MDVYSEVWRATHAAPVTTATALGCSILSGLGISCELTLSLMDGPWSWYECGEVEFEVEVERYGK